MDLRNEPMKAARSPIRAGSTASIFSRIRRATTGDEAAAGADGNDDVAAIDDGGKDEGGMREVVHHIDGQSDRISRAQTWRYRCRRRRRKELQ